MAIFHSNAGRGVVVSADRRTVGASYGPGTVFSDQTLVPMKRMQLCIRESSGYLAVGITSCNPSTYNPDQHIHDLPRTWLLGEKGFLHHGWSKTSVCPPWSVSQGDKVSIEWDAPQVTVYHNETQLHQWNAGSPESAWLIANIGVGIVATLA